MNLESKQKIAGQITAIYQNTLLMTTVHHLKALFPLHTDYAITPNFGKDGKAGLFYLASLTNQSTCF